ncbi:NlpC/P60 family protein [Nostocoides sp. F2B08]|uniref:C40 family peptidase n=1 Tax=Nostocoides sp. F2B08 TaxID=2653936 RepID=UPI0012639870|nr:C40 family peptidase [Tetrasphaera sp. F2B08]KAB7741380.1 NlpC/P60 family protein [Tetrasphaera sp. F2B08]
MTVKSHGRHRTAGRYNPLSELSLIASRASSPAIKGSAVIAASGGLVAAFAIPANAVGQAPAAPVTAEPAEGSAATLSISERASEVATSRAVARPALTAPAVAAPTVAPSFGKLSFTAVEKPPPPPPPPVETPAASESSSSSSGGSSSSGSSGGGSSSSGSSSSSAPKADRPQRVASGGVLGVAASLTGIPYVYGGSTPAGFDCSGFTQYVFAQVGISLGRTTYAQYAQTYAVSDPRPGDLVFYGGSSPWHVGIYAGNGMMYDSPRTGKSTSLRPLFSGSPEIRRIG